jgi:hypothetical protein
VRYTAMKWFYLIIGFALGALAHFLYSGAASDQGAVRTDLTIYRDAETGCEYLKPAWSFSGLTPRNDSLGVPICSDEGVSDRVEQMLDDVGKDGQDAPPAIEATPPETPEAAPPEGNAPAPAPPQTPPAATPSGPGAVPPSP